MSAEKSYLHATSHPFRQLRFHRLVRDPQLRRDLLVRKSIKHSQSHHLPTAHGELPDRRRQQRQLLLTVHRLSGIRGFLERPDRGDVLHRFNPHHSPPPEEIQRRVARRREEEGLRITDPPVLPRPNQASIGLLHQVIHVRKAREDAAQIPPKGALVRLHLVGEPLRNGLRGKPGGI
jgi:hypothetical protein